jgi:uncharacterized protein
MLSENFVLSGLLRQFEELPRYWRSGNLAEVDFLIQYQNNIIPVEVKSDENIKSRSLIVYRQNFSPELSLRFSLRNLRKEEGFISLPHIKQQIICHETDNLYEPPGRSFAGCCVGGNRGYFR